MENKAYSPPQSNLARQIKRGRVGVHIVDFPSIKNSRVIVCESKLEADFCQLLEFDPEVVSYTPQPQTITLYVNGVLTNYTPDFQVAYQFRPDGFFEIKPDEVTSWDEYQALMAAAAQYFPEMGYSFRLMLGSEIRQEPMLSNLRYFYSKLHVVSEHEYKYLLEHLKRSGGKANYAELLEMPVPPSIGAIAKGIYSQTIDVDLNLSLGRDTVLRLRG